MYKYFSNLILGAAAGVGLAFMAMEIRRRQARLRAIYDILDEADQELCAKLEQLAATGELTPYQRSKS